MNTLFGFLRFILLVGWVLPLAVTLWLADSYWTAEVLPRLNGRAPLNSFDFLGAIRIATAVTVLWLAAAATAVALMLRPA